MKRLLKLKLLPVILVLVLSLSLAGACSDDTKDEAQEETREQVTETTETTEPALSGTLQVFHAGSLAVPLAEVNEAFTKLYPDVEVLAEGAGSATTIRKVTELGKECGIIASADYSLIPELMYPDYADWYIIFATNQMCICYTDQSAYADEITSDNWYEILQREGVTYGRSDPDQDPCGYRTLMVWQLAEKHYGVNGIHDNLYQGAGDLMRPKSVELIALLESGDLDYAFEYTSVAAQHSLNYVELPAAINLADATQKDFYAEAQVEIAGTEPGTTITMTGSPIVYGVTIPSNFPHKELAIAWLEVMLGKTGTDIMKANGQPPVTPAPTDNKAAVPQELQKYLQ
ncbi:MAG: tungstate ABC transporter substrate-binding protein WtpA [Dehalococcoidales bacterium]|nr:tungstate ABC transporter substrate-binding protein WtpA [Dehalococcoidales bacterium]